MTVELEQQLRDYASHVTDLSSPVDVETLPRQDVIVGAESLSRNRRPRLAVASAAAMVVLVLIGGLAVGYRLLASESTPVVTQPNPETTLPPPSPSMVPSPALDSWQRVGADLMQPVVGILDITQAGSRLIAAGFDPGENYRQDGVIFASNDGFNWVRLAENDPALTTGTVLIYGITEGGPGLVAVGMSCEDDAFPCETGPHPTVWTSVDGTVWTRTPNTPDVFGEIGSLQDVVVTEREIVAAGVLDGFDGTDGTSAAVWLSTDGTDWARVWDGSPDTGIGALAAGPDGLIVGVGSAVNQLGEAVAAVWVSTDGRNWERIAAETAAFGSQAGLDVHMLDVAAGPSGFIAVGTEDGTRVAIWHSPDGRAWTRADTADQPFGATGALSSVAALGSGWTAGGPGVSGEGVGPVTLWTSVDGSTWDRVLVTGSTYAEAIVVTDGGITAVAGGMPEDDDFHAAVWAGPTFDPSLPPPDPLPSSPPSIASLDEGLTCAEIATAGYSYAQAVAYWARHQLPTVLDSDRNGLPCEGDYPDSDITDVFGAHEAMWVQLASDLPEGTFAATGPAVDNGILCPAGLTEFTPEPEPTRSRALKRWEDLYTCDDGSGTFIVGVDVFAIVRGVEYGIWDIGSGTGDYQSLTGGGRADTASTGDRTWSDVLDGRLTSEIDEN